VSSGTGVHDTVVNQLLTKIDGVDALNNILLIGMTNRCVLSGFWLMSCCVCVIIVASVYVCAVRARRGFRLFSFSTQTCRKNSFC